jgi:hypothetical protein
MAHEITWLKPDGSPAPDRGKGSVEDTVSHLPKVKDAVHKKALTIGRDAHSKLAAHRRKGKAYIEVARHENASADTPDWYVYLKDEDPGGGDGEYVRKNRLDRSAMSIEFGWVQRKAFGKKLAQPVRHEGLHILGGAMQRAINRYRGPQ